MMMRTKPLYILVSNGGDGSYNPVFTLDEAWIAQQQARYDAGELDCEDEGVDGDGFHHTVIQVPADATYESLGINRYLVRGENAPHVPAAPPPAAGVPAVTGITIVRGSGADHVMVHVDAPEPTWPFRGRLCMSFNAAQDTGEAYCSGLWPGITPEVVERSCHA